MIRSKAYLLSPQKTKPLGSPRLLTSATAKTSAPTHHSGFQLLFNAWFFGNFPFLQVQWSIWEGTCYTLSHFSRCLVLEVFRLEMEEPPAKSVAQVTKFQRMDACYGAHLLHSRSYSFSTCLCSTCLCQAPLRTWNTELKKANQFSELKERIMGRHTMNKERNKKTLILKYLFIVTCLFLWLWRVLVVAHRIFNLCCGIQDSLVVACELLVATYMLNHSVMSNSLSMGLSQQEYGVSCHLLL